MRRILKIYMLLIDIPTYYKINCTIQYYYITVKLCHKSKKNVYFIREK